MKNYYNMLLIFILFAFILSIIQSFPFEKETTYINFFSDKAEKASNNVSPSSIQTKSVLRNDIDLNKDPNTSDFSDNYETESINFICKITKRKIYELVKLFNLGTDETKITFKKNILDKIQSTFQSFTVEDVSILSDLFHLNGILPSKKEYIQEVFKLFDKQKETLYKNRKMDVLTIRSFIKNLWESKLEKQATIDRDRWLYISTTFYYHPSLRASFVSNIQPQDSRLILFRNILNDHTLHLLSIIESEKLIGILSWLHKLLVTRICLELHRYEY